MKTAAVSVVCKVETIHQFNTLLCQSIIFSHLILQNLPVIPWCWYVALVQEYLLVVVVRVFVFQCSVSSSVDLNLPAQSDN